MCQHSSPLVFLASPNLFAREIVHSMRLRGRGFGVIQAGRQNLACKTVISFRFIDGEIKL